MNKLIRKKKNQYKLHEWVIHKKISVILIIYVFIKTLNIYYNLFWTVLSPSHFTSCRSLSEYKDKLHFLVFGNFEMKDKWPMERTRYTKIIFTKIYFRSYRTLRLKNTCFQLNYSSHGEKKSYWLNKKHSMNIFLEFKDIQPQS